ncbi:MAG: hypothetical protein KKH83_07850 [Candidatus Margulisbacteria bacterium]|nr:hypothetical protein [Candidatus Margulisiibacteriota bacterium]
MSLDKVNGSKTPAKNNDTLAFIRKALLSGASSYSSMEKMLLQYKAQHGEGFEVNILLARVYLSWFENSSSGCVNESLLRKGLAAADLAMKKAPSSNKPLKVEIRFLRAKMYLAAVEKCVDGSKYFEPAQSELAYVASNTNDAAMLAEVQRLKPGSSLIETARASFKKGDLPRASAYASRVIEQNDAGKEEAQIIWSEAELALKRPGYLDTVARAMRFYQESGLAELAVKKGYFKDRQAYFERLSGLASTLSEHYRSRCRNHQKWETGDPNVTSHYFDPGRHPDCVKEKEYGAMMRYFIERANPGQ